MVEPDEDNTAWRRTLRREMVAKRAALGDEAHAGLSAGIVGHLLTALPAPQVGAFCWPIKHEPDVRAGSIAGCRRRGRAARVSAVDAGHKAGAGSLRNTDAHFG